MIIQTRLRSLLSSGFALTLLLMGLTANNLSYAQSNTTTRIFMVTETPTAYSILRGDIGTDNFVEIYTLPKTTQESFGIFLPNDELQVATAYFVETNTPQDIRNNLLNGSLQVFIKDISASADNQKVALTVLYQSCVTFPFSACFGATRIVLLTNNKVTMLWQVGYHSTQYLPVGCVVNSVSRFFIAGVREVQWTRTGDAVIAAFSNSGTDKCLTLDKNARLFMFPVSSGTSAFHLADGIVWTMASDSNTVSLISRECNSSTDCQDTLHIVNFDTNNSKVVETKRKLGSFLAEPSAGLARAGNDVIFAGYSATTAEAGIIVANVTAGARLSSASSVLPGGIARVSNSSKNPVTILEDQNGLLWRVEVITGDINLVPLASKPVRSWSIGQGGLLIQFQSDTDYVFLSNQGNILKRTNLANKVPSTERSHPIVSVN